MEGVDEDAPVIKTETDEEMEDATEAVAAGKEEGLPDEEEDVKPVAPKQPAVAWTAAEDRVISSVVQVAAHEIFNPRATKELHTAADACLKV